MFCACFLNGSLQIWIILFAPSVHESDATGHGHEDGEHGRKPWHEAQHAAWHGRTGQLIEYTQMIHKYC